MYNVLNGANGAQATILVVGPSQENAASFAQPLAMHYSTHAVDSLSCTQWLAAQSILPDLILLNISAESTYGWKMLASIKANNDTHAIPVIIISANVDEEFTTYADVADFLVKPVTVPAMLARIRAQLALKYVCDQNAALRQTLLQQCAEYTLAQDATIHTLARMAEARDPETGRHLWRTQAYVRNLAMKLRLHPRFSAFLTDRNVELLIKSAPLHDIGKVGIPDNILFKPGRLTDAETTIMRTHARIGSALIEQAERDIHHAVEFLTIAKQVARHHHERWDGSGYPDGLAGESIPIAARLMAVADVFDALITRRAYKAPTTCEQAHQVIMAGSGSQFDPDVAAAFAACFDEFKALAQRYSEIHPPLAADMTAASANFVFSV